MTPLAYKSITEIVNALFDPTGKLRILLPDVLSVSAPNPIPVSGTLNVTAQAPLPVTGTLVLPPATSDVATITISPVITNTSKLVIAANPLRKGLILYNNSANSVYLALGSAANSSTNMTYILATFAHLIFPAPIYTGAVYGIRNGAGTGTVLATELT
jgi:hypothetical protein